ncbi:MAG: hypothetical protein KU38_07075 [Sulfurovum sp. FS08-3]|nr:MAG: hypothetical protein KU38_07075 [Sulfurovum sp. FS08-3]
MKLSPTQSTPKELLLYIALAYIFGLLVRLMVLQNVWGVESLWYEGRILPIWSDDAGLYGYYAKQILAGVSYPFENDYILSYGIATIVKVTGIDIDWVMLLLPAFLAPLVVIPILLMGYWLGVVKFALYASLIGVIGINYYTRSYLGYTDTDTINLLLVYFLIATFVVVAYKQNLRYAAVGIVALVFLYTFYHSSKSLIAGVLAINFLMVLIFYPKSKVLYGLLLLLGLAFVLVFATHPLIALIVPLVLLGVLEHPILERLDYRFYATLFAVLLVGGAMVVDSNALYARALDYFSLNHLTTIGEYQITNVLATVAENQQRSIFDIFGQFVGIWFYVIVATLGYIVLVYRKREFVFLVPLLLLGYLSFKIGIRFTMYAEMVLALGFVYGLYALKKEDWVHIGVAFAIALMAYNIMQVNRYIKPKYFVADDIKALHALAIKPQDTIISWWDYGWPLWYYVGSQNTYIDNGANQAGGTVFVAKMLFATPQIAYDIAKLIATRTQDLRLLENEHTIHEGAKTIALGKHNVYIMLHRNMLRTFNTLATFADRDLANGTMSRQRAFGIAPITHYDRDSFGVGGENFNLDIAKGILTQGATSLRLHSIITFQNNQILSSKLFGPNSRHSVILHNKHLISIDNDSLNTLFIQTLILNRTLGEYFGLLFETSNLKIFNLK